MKSPWCTLSLYWMKDYIWTIRLNIMLILSRIWCLVVLSQVSITSSLVYTPILQSTRSNCSHFIGDVFPWRISMKSRGRFGHIRRSEYFRRWRWFVIGIHLLSVVCVGLSIAVALTANVTCFTTKAYGIIRMVGQVPHSWVSPATYECVTSSLELSELPRK